MLIEKNISNVLEKIRLACEKSNRDIKEVTLIAVSKTKPNEMILEAYNAGMKDFGENKVQELKDKIVEIEKPIKWHMIGHLQRNKVKYIIENVELIHSVDSFRLAEKINQEAKKISRKVNILIQVNVSEEESKFGVHIDEVEELLNRISTFNNIKVKGLMTVAPFTDSPEDNRIFFKKLSKLSVDIKSKNIDNIDMEYLSMGMTNDYEIAIEEGANLIRVGTGIFGNRIYK